MESDGRVNEQTVDSKATESEEELNVHDVDAPETEDDEDDAMDQED